MVVDACAVVALFKREATAVGVRAALAQASTLIMPSVTLTEVVLIGLKDGRPVATMADWITGLGIEIVPVDSAQAVIAAEARRRYPIRFGDAFVYALAKARDLPVLTLDAEFMKTDVALVPLA